MCKVIKFDRSVKRYGLKTRQATVGAELDLLHSFLKRYAKSLTGDCDYAIFIEPRIPTGCPDCVVVKYDAKVYDAWPKSRHRLSDLDLKVLFYVMRASRRRKREIAKHLCVRPIAAEQSLERLISNGDVVESIGGWVSAAKQTRFGIREITSIEAKVHDWRKVADQAALNRAFSTMSYALMPRKVMSPAMREYVSNAGIGMYGYSKENGTQLLLPGHRSNFFSSYLPLYFNEWIGWRLNSAGRRRHD